MNWQALNAACGFYTLGRVWSTMRREFSLDRSERWYLVPLCYVFVVALWPLLWVVFALDELSRRSAWFGVRWRRLWRDEEGGRDGE